jgi:hypothetical protein
MGIFAIEGRQNFVLIIMVKVFQNQLSIILKPFARVTVPFCFPSAHLSSM